MYCKLNKTHFPVLYWLVNDNVESLRIAERNEEWLEKILFYWIPDPNANQVINHKMKIFTRDTFSNADIIRKDGDVPGPQEYDHREL